MNTAVEYTAARDALLARTVPVGTETLPLAGSYGRVLAEDLVAAENIPAFDRSPYDGYAFRAADVAGASREAPVTLRITEEIPAGAVPTVPVTAGTAAKILTGAPLPPGADTIINYELTEFTPETVTLFAPVTEGKNVVRAGDDVRKGDLLAAAGTVIDAGTAGTLAAQGVARPRVYRVPRVAVLSTGSELVEADETPAPGLIRNSNAYTISAALRGVGLEPVYLGIARDTEEGIAALLEQGLADCDAVISTGGVSVGDYDLTPAALARVGAEVFVRGVRLKPGMACAYAVRAGKLLCALSGNPASCITNFYTVALPALYALAGRRDPLPKTFPVALADPFPKASPEPRVLRGSLDLGDGTARMRLSRDQGNVALSATIGWNVVAVIPAGSGPLEPGAVLQGFLL